MMFYKMYMDYLYKILCDLDHFFIVQYRKMILFLYEHYAKYGVPYPNEAFEIVEKLIFSGHRRTYNLISTLICLPITTKIVYTEYKNRNIFNKRFIDHIIIYALICIPILIIAFLVDIFYYFILDIILDKYFKK